MGKRVQIAVAILLVALVGVIAWQVLRSPEREPVYQGKRLSVWLQRYRATGSYIDFQPEPEADEAVRQIGTNAIPTLLQLLRMHDSKLKLMLWMLSNKEYFMGIRVLPVYFRARQAATAFHALGANASNAVPALIQTYRDSIGLYSHCACAEALGRIGPAASEAIPDLLSAATNSDNTLRAFAVEALGRIHTEPELVLPVLTKSLQDSDFWVRRYAVSSLAGFGSAAKPAVSVLTQSLNDPDSLIRKKATNALKQIDPEAAAKAGVR